MLSTPIALSQHAHDLSQPYYAPFRDHLLSRRQSSQYPMHTHSQDRISSGLIRLNGHDCDDPVYAQNGLSLPKPVPKSIAQHLEPATEHMLRRKTPNGTLKAGYDGTPVEWASAPPAHKHHVTRSGPRDESLDASFRRQACLLLSGPATQTQPYPMNPCPPTDTYGWFDAGFDGLGGSKRSMLQRAGPGQQLDSMLYQGTPQFQPFQNAYTQIPFAQQPTWPRNLEPTASGPPMPYGPYWPNGAFEPYRPIPTRDGRFDSQFARINLNDSSDQAPWQRQERRRDTLPMRDSVYLGPATTPGVRFDFRPSFAQRQTQSEYFPDQREFLPTEPALSRVNNGNSFVVGPLPRSDPSPSSSIGFSTPVSDYQHPAPQLQFKEMALTQAHRAYVALLASVQQTRKQMQQNRQPSKDIPNFSLFPKPPRHSYPFGATNVRANNFTSLRPPGHNPYVMNGPHTPFGSSSNNVQHDARNSLELLRNLAKESNWQWTEAILLAGCLSYGLNNFSEAVQMFQKVLHLEPANVEAMSNLAAAYMTQGNREEAERHWSQSVKRSPGYFEAVEHLVGLLCVQQRTTDAINVIQHVENSLRVKDGSELPGPHYAKKYKFDELPGTLCNPYSGTSVASHSGYRIQPVENGRLIALVHAKGNMLYASGNIIGAANAFEEAIMIAVGKTVEGISGLIRRILGAFSTEIRRYKEADESLSPWETILLLPKTAVRTSQLTFANSRPLPGLDEVAEGQPKKAAIAVTSNCLLSLAKIYQDSMSSGGTALGPSGATGVQDILALYYLSLSLQPSPSTANNVGILLASVQQSASSRLPPHLVDNDTPTIPGVVPGTGVALALAYYNYGLHLDNEHAHLYTNLGSLLKDLGQLDIAIRMYEQAVRCDGKFDIALANLANAVKDRGRISDAIGYYRRAVDANPDFAEAVCGLANALNSVCGWTGRGGIVFSDRRFDRWHVDEQGTLVDAREAANPSTGWVGRVVAIVNKQLTDGRAWGKNLLTAQDVQNLAHNAAVLDKKQLQRYLSLISSWMGQDYEGAKVVRFVERATRQVSWQWYQDKFVQRDEQSIDRYQRPQLPAALTVPNAPTVLPFHTFTCPLTASQTRQISQRNGLRISASTLKAPWLPAHVFSPPRPPKPYLNIGYVSSDFNNHPLAHLMQSVFGMHDPKRVRAICYATTPSDKSIHRQKIELEAPTFWDASTWPIDRLVKQIVSDEIHILVNLNGYTRGARNEVFAARPAPIQMSFMGFAGTLGAEWCDYLLADETAVPTSTLRPHRANVNLFDTIEDENFSDRHNEWIYGENIIYTRDTFFCCDHRQSAPDAQEAQPSWSDELVRRRAMRKELFPNLPDDVVILGNFNQLYKIEPTTFRTWLRILQAVPKAVLWLLRFPDLGEHNLRAMAEKWSSPDVSSRIHFTDVAPKHLHIARARICDLFLDTPECNAHTTSADVLWSGTPLLTYPRYEFKMCSRMAASILRGAMPKSAAGQEAADELIVSSDKKYEEKAIELTLGLAEVWAGHLPTCRALEIRKLIYENRWTSPLFDTQRWTRDLEAAYEIAWDKWVKGEGGDIWL